MNENEIGRIAAAANLLRPDWPIASIKTLLEKPELVNRPRRDVAVALVWVACESDTKTPSRVLTAGPWWQASAVDRAPEENLRRPPRKDEECAKHPGQYAPPICNACHADRKGRRDAENEAAATQQRLARDEARAAARLALASAEVCSHGVPPSHCVDHKAEPGADHRVLATTEPTEES